MLGVKDLKAWFLATDSGSEHRMAWEGGGEQGRRLRWPWFLISLNSQVACTSEDVGGGGEVTWEEIAAHVQESMVEAGEASSAAQGSRA